MSYVCFKSVKGGKIPPETADKARGILATELQKELDNVVSSTNFPAPPPPSVPVNSASALATADVTPAQHINKYPISVLMRPTAGPLIKPEEKDKTGKKARWMKQRSEHYGRVFGVGGKNLTVEHLLVAAPWRFVNETLFDASSFARPSLMYDVIEILILRVLRTKDYLESLREQFLSRQIRFNYSIYKVGQTNCVLHRSLMGKPPLSETLFGRTPEPSQRAWVFLCATKDRYATAANSFIEEAVQRVLEKAEIPGITVKRTDTWVGTTGNGLFYLSAHLAFGDVDLIADDSDDDDSDTDEEERGRDDDSSDDDSSDQ